MLYRSARAVGYQAVEMAPPHRWAMAKEIGLRVLNIAGPGMQSGLNRLDNHPLLLTKIEKLIATAHENDIQQIIVFTGNRAGQRDEDGIAHTIAALRTPRTSGAGQRGDAASGITMPVRSSGLPGRSNLDRSGDRAWRRFIGRKSALRYLSHARDGCRPDGRHRQAPRLHRPSARRGSETARRAAGGGSDRLSSIDSTGAVGGVRRVVGAGISVKQSS